MAQGAPQNRNVFPQHTLAAEVQLQGVGLHTGKAASLRVLPAPVDTGIVWRRRDLPGTPAVTPSLRGLLDAVGNTERATSLRCGDASIQTVEHVMAALAGLGIDNAIVELDGPEPPMLDGSAALYAEALARAGVVPQDSPRYWPRLPEPVYLEAGDAIAVAVPADGLQLAYTFVSDHPALGCQFAEFHMSPQEGREAFAVRFQTHIAPARTVGWLHEVEALRRRGLAQGASLEAAVVVDERQLVTPMRLPHEVARHKLLDLLGDLYLIGPIQARVVALRTGHRHHVALARRMADALAALR